MRAVTAKEMKRLDREAIDDYGIPGSFLMEKAGRGLAAAVIRQLERSRKKRVVIFCGKGNNGGDGYVCARYLLKCGIDVAIYAVSGTSSVKGDAALNLKTLKRLKAPLFNIKKVQDVKAIELALRQVIIVDAIFGIGFKGRPEGIYRQVIELINMAPSYTLSVDLPSGLNATTGIAAGCCVKADETITMGMPKTGFYKKEGPIYVGRISVIDIGLPSEALA
ncbi:MAG: NAD(P)H-hydrate epimerase [Candidatus Omnitrophica bacterium]|nr:NAD(P)H-hydrate epimerase [Candidatus Omnitrophota bacterium]